MIDIHTHILYGLDDGAETIETALSMLKMAYSDGISEIVLTPHVAEEFKYELREAKERFLILKNECGKNRIDIKLHLGFEVRIDKDLIKKFEYDINSLTVNGKGKYVLLEFPFLDIPLYYKEIIKFFTSSDITPVIVHPLRNGRIAKNLSFLNELADLGCLLQFNIDDTRSDKVSLILPKLIKKNLVHFIASDCHSIDLRPPILSDGYRFVEKSAGKKYAELLFIENPKNLVDGEIIDTEDLRGKGFFDRISDIFKG